MSPDPARIKWEHIRTRLNFRDYLIGSVVVALILFILFLLAGHSLTYALAWSLGMVVWIFIIFLLVEYPEAKREMKSWNDDKYLPLFWHGFEIADPYTLKGRLNGYNLCFRRERIPGKPLRWKHFGMICLRPPAAPEAKNRFLQALFRHADIEAAGFTGPMLIFKYKKHEKDFLSPLIAALTQAATHHLTALPREPAEKEWEKENERMWEEKFSRRKKRILKWGKFLEISYWK